MAGGDFATVLKQQQKALTELDRTQEQLTQGQRQQYTQARSNAALGAALVAAQVVGTRAAVAGLTRQVQAQQQLGVLQQRQAREQVVYRERERRAADVAIGQQRRQEETTRRMTTAAAAAAGRAPTTAATVAAFEAEGRSKAAAANMARRASQEELKDRAAALKAEATMQARALDARTKELTAGKGERGRGLQKALERAAVPGVALAPHREAFQLAEATVRAQAEQKLIAGEKGFAAPLGRGAGPHRLALDKVAEMRLGLAAEMAKIDREKLKVEAGALDSIQAQEAAEAQTAVWAQRQVNEAKKRHLMAQSTSHAQMRAVAQQEHSARRLEGDNAAYMRRQMAAADVAYMKHPDWRRGERERLGDETTATRLEAIARANRARLAGGVAASRRGVRAARAGAAADYEEEILAERRAAVAGGARVHYLGSGFGRMAMQRKFDETMQRRSAEATARAMQLASDRAFLGGGTHLGVAGAEFNARQAEEIVRLQEAGMAARAKRGRLRTGEGVKEEMIRLEADAVRRQHEGEARLEAAGIAGATLADPRHQIAAVAQATADAAERSNEVGRRAVAAKARLRVLGDPAFALRHQQDFVELAQTAGYEDAARGRRADLERAVMARGHPDAGVYAGAQRERVRADTAEESRNLQAAAVAAREKAKWLASPEGLKATREQTRLQQDLAKAERQQRFRELVGESGRFGAGLRLIGEEFGKMGVNLREFGTQLQYAFLGGVAGMSALVAAASPVVWNTLLGSIQSVSIELGGALLPYADALSLQLQRASRWLATLSPQIKDNAAQIAIWGVGIVGVTAVLIKLGITVVTVTAHLKTLGVVMSLSSLTPALIGLAAVAAAVALIGVKWYESSRRAEEAAGAMEKMQGVKGEIEAGRRPAYEVLLPHMVEKLTALSRRPDRAAAEKEQEEFLAAQEQHFRERVAGRAMIMTQTELDLLQALEKGRVKYVEKVAEFRATDPGRPEPFIREAAALAASTAFARALTPETVKAVYGDRVPADITLFGDFPRAEQEAKHKAVLELPRLINAREEALATALAKIREGVGAGGTAAQQEQLLRSGKGFPAPAYLQAAQLAEKYQLSLLGTGDLERDNARK